MSMRGSAASNNPSVARINTKYVTKEIEGK